MLPAHDLGAEDAAGGIQRVHGGVDAQGRNGAAEHRGGVQMGEGGGGGGVGQVVGRHVNSLDGRNGALLGGGDALLQSAHFGGQRRLVAHGAGHAAQQCGHLGTRLGETEDVVDEEQHVLVFLIAEILGHGQSGKPHAHTGSRRLVHLAVDQGSLVDDAAFLHFIVQVVALAGAFSHAREHGQAAVLLGDVVDQFHDQHRLAHARAAEQADLAALGVGSDEVHHLDTRFEDLGRRLLFLIGGGGAMDGPAFLGDGVGLVVDGLAQQVEDAAQALVAHRHGDGAAGIHRFQAAHHAVGGVHGDAARHVVADVLRHFRGDLLVPVLNFNGVEQLGQLPVLKPDVQHGADDLNHLANILVAHDWVAPFGGCKGIGIRE